MQKEAKARIKINNLLQESGWRFFDDEHGTANIVLENNVKLTKQVVDELGNDFDKTKNGFIDFLLLDEKCFPYAVLEAKSEDKDPLDGKEQARRYAQSQNVRFIVLSNGNVHYFWDLERGNPSFISSFPTQESLKHFVSYKPDSKKLTEEKVSEDYIALTQNPTYQKDPRWQDEVLKHDQIQEQDLKFLRPYQLRAITALQESAQNGNDRYLFEMATGTGKTLTCAAVIKLFLKTGNAKRILFLVDRIELEDQAAKNFKKYLAKDFTSVIYKENRDDWRKAEIVVSTVQSLSTNTKYKKLFNPTDFDLIISDKGYSLLVDTEEGKEEQVFYQSDFERKFFSDKTNLIFCETFLKNALMDQISGEVGKSIIYCVSQKHASKITQLLNQLADSYWPGKYNSDFAVQVTSNIPDAQQFTIGFANNNLNGHTPWLEGYKSSKTRVCVTVGMMTTGYDCQDILNLCLMRPIFSPTDFIQIKGRGTRKYTFTNQTQENGETETTKEAKDKFKLFDFFANCEYFEEKYDYDEILKLPHIMTGPGGDGPEPINIDEVISAIPDPLKTFQEQTVGPQGMKVDRKLFDKFEEAIKADSFIKEKYEQGDIQAVEDYVKTEIFDKPQDYFSLDKLRKSVKVDRRLSLREIIDKIFGRLDNFKNKDELLDEEYDKFVSIYKPESKYAMPIKNYIKAYITDGEIRDIIESGEYPRLATNAKLTLQDLRELNGWIKVVPEYVKDYVSLNTFMN